jgi:hypothetical protein
MSPDWSFYNVKYCRTCNDRIRLSQHILYDGTCFSCLEDIRDAERENRKKEIEKLKAQVDWDD